MIYCSNLEKTLLDSMHIRKKKGAGDAVLSDILKEYLEEVKGKIILRYAKAYPKTIRAIVKGALFGLQ